MREEDERYFGRLEDELDVAMDVASEAKARGGDPKPDVEIPIAKDMPTGSRTSSGSTASPSASATSKAR